MLEPLKTFLDRLTFKPSPRRVCEKAAALLTNNLPVAVTAEMLRFEQGILYLNVSSVFRSEIALKKEFLLVALKKEIPTLRDLR